MTTASATLLRVRRHDEITRQITDLVRDSTRERCGLVYGDYVIEIDNVHADPENYFEMDPEQQMDAWSEFGRPDYVWHSHPNNDPEPSEADRLGAPPGIGYLIAARNRVYQYEF